MSRLKFPGSSWSGQTSRFAAHVHSHWSVPELVTICAVLAVKNFWNHFCNRIIIYSFFKPYSMQFCANSSHTFEIKFYLWMFCASFQKSQGNRGTPVQPWRKPASPVLGDVALPSHPLLGPTLPGTFSLSPGRKVVNSEGQGLSQAWTTPWATAPSRLKNSLSTWWPRVTGLGQQLLLPGLPSVTGVLPASFSQEHLRLSLVGRPGKQPGGDRN